MYNPPPASPAPVGRRPGPPAALGLLLAGPAVLAWLVTLVVPSLQTIYKSFQKSSLFGHSKLVGLDNYTKLLQDSTFWKSIGATVTVSVLPCLIAVAVAPVLALALDAGGSVTRRIGRVLISVPLVTFSPVAFALAEVHESGSRFKLPTNQLGVSLDTAAASIGVVLGLVILFALAAAGGRAEGRPVLTPMLVVAAVAGLATAAVAIQAFTFFYLYRLPGTGRSGMTYLMYAETFQYAQIGYGSAIATLIGLLVGLLGTAAAVLAVTTRLRFALAPRMVRWRPTGPVGLFCAIAGLVVLLGLLLAPFVPWLSTITGSSRSAQGSYLYTWGPPILHAVLAVGIAYIAALGISGFRPLGARSEWLLLPLAPWLFVGMTPLATQGYVNAKDLGMLNSFLGLVPPILVSVPALFVLSLFFRGQSARWRAYPTTGFFGAVVLPSLPLAVLLAGAVVLMDGQGVLWQLIVSSDRAHAPVPVATLERTFGYAFAVPDLKELTPWFVVVPALIGLLVLQFLYLDRLVLSGGRLRPEENE